MAHFNRVRPMGMWVSLGNLYASELEVIDANLAKAINGDGGGTWTPTTQIVIGGSGLKVTGLFWSTGGFRVEDLAELHGALEVDGAVVFHDNLTVQGTTSLGAAAINQLTVTGDAQFDNNIDVDGAVDVGGTLAVAGATSLQAVQATSIVATSGGNLGSGTLTITSSGGTLARPINSATTGRIRKRTLTVNLDADQSFSADGYDIIRVPAGVISSSRSYTLIAAGAGEGDSILIVNNDSNHPVNVYDQSANPLNVLMNKTANMRWAEYVFMSGGWRDVASGPGYVP